jgi:plasmid stability protein
MHYNVISACIVVLRSNKTMNQLTIRGIDSKLHHDLKVEAERRGLSINRYVLSILHGTLGGDNGSQRSKSVQYHDLDHLAGTWTQGDAAEFERQLTAQRPIEEDLWA